MISINFFSIPEGEKPPRSRSGKGPLKINTGQNIGDDSSSGTVPDPESLDFREYEDEDPEDNNRNGEPNEEPGEQHTGEKNETGKVDPDPDNNNGDGLLSPAY